MKKHTKKYIQISDHALVRFIERVMEVDLDPIRNDMISDSLRKAAELNGGNGVVVLPNCKMVLRDNIIATVLSTEQLTHKPSNGKPFKKSIRRRPGFANSSEATGKVFRSDKGFIES